jgi:hypothetical protein
VRSCHHDQHKTPTTIAVTSVKAAEGGKYFDTFGLVVRCP